MGMARRGADAALVGYRFGTDYAPRYPGVLRFEPGPFQHFRRWGAATARGARNSQSLPAMRPYILDPELPLPVTFAQIRALIAPRPLLVGQAAGEQRPREEENAAEVQRVYQSHKAADRVRYVWYAGDHDFPPEARAAAVEWFRRWLSHP